MNTIILHSQDQQLATQISEKIAASVEEKSTHFRLHADYSAPLDDLRDEFRVDINYLPAFDFSKAGLFVSDMDSTLINIECIDEIADFAHLKPQVAEITERAMQGGMDFSASLIERVALLQGLDIAVLSRVYVERLKVNKGGEALIQFLKTQHIKTAVVSGGFTYFTQRLAQDIGLDYNRANTLAIEDNRLTGKVKGGIIDATAKAEFLAELCAKHQILPHQAIAIGDGANDLEMMAVAGLSVAYRAKPAVLEYADIVINYGGLDIMVDFFEE
ncbi:phosphoserine phosphatase SerB [Bathymodiolus thermophilus thioautotrophic gill symbiont]|uniref:Phosphoserine phosphatase n=1 Tax=Bathymodiolus thermophilus thioautotrophic gill symbiont TaxID=2360 RepID=A0A8H9CHX3_9GAMM|nr:phosphoserine phosphatase SerB [Bathymodiolus thermophilus thioautotrophic gill symbiont]CAB5502243.1 Phosphoserine phosphatase (EC [Bathymodiolus thermophilus thioautotrophic gill symbiont]